MSLPGFGRTRGCAPTGYSYHLERKFVFTLGRRGHAKHGLSGALFYPTHPRSNVISDCYSPRTHNLAILIDLADFFTDYSYEVIAIRDH